MYCKLQRAELEKLYTLKYLWAAGMRQLGTRKLSKDPRLLNEDRSRESILSLRDIIDTYKDCAYGFV